MDVELSWDDKKPAFHDFWFRIYQPTCCFHDSTSTYCLLTSMLILMALCKMFG